MLYLFPQLKKMGVRWGGGGSCETINAALYAGQHIPCNPFSLGMTLFPQSYIGEHTGQHLYNLIQCNLILYCNFMSRLSIDFTI